MRTIAVVIAATLLSACAPLTGARTVARTLPPVEGFHDRWCEAETRTGGLTSCSAPRGASMVGERCACLDLKNDDVAFGRVVLPPSEDFSASSPAFLDPADD